MAMVIDRPFNDSVNYLNGIHQIISGVKARTGKLTKLKMWRANIEEVTVPPEYWGPVK